MKTIYKIFIGNLPWTVANKELANYFSKYGHVVSASVLFNKDNGMTRGYGFVIMGTKDAYNSALNKVNHNLEGRVLTVQPANPNS